MTALSSHVIVADDDVREASVLTWLLRERGYDVSSGRAADALSLMARRPADLLFLDGDTANGQGVLDVLDTLRGDERARDLPVIVAGATHTPALRGQADLLSRPLQLDELLARVELHLGARAEVRRLRQELERREEELRRALEDMAATRQLVEILNEVTAELSAAEIYRVLARRVARALDLRHCSIVLADAGSSVGTVVAAYDDPSISDLQVQIERYPELASALRTGRPVLVADVLQDPMFAEVRELWKREGLTAPVRSVLTIPFAIERKRGGVFFIRTERGERTLTVEDSAFAEVVIRAAVAAIRRAHALDSTRADNRRLEELATTDALTRLLNRRALLERLSVEVDRARRFKSTLSLLIVDLDFFKSVNDQHGHLVGDSILRQVGTLLEGAVRTIDVVARYGGEEFVLLLPETALDGATVFGERLRERVAEHPFELAAERAIHLTCSVGVATFPSPRVDSTEDLFARADEALYRAKSNGRNQVRS